MLTPKSFQIPVANSTGHSTGRTDHGRYTVIFFENGSGLGYQTRSGQEIHTTAPLAAVFEALPQEVEQIGVGYIPTRRELMFRADGTQTICVLEKKDGVWWRHTGRVPADLEF